jgi:T-complex protein 1 subunit theta
MGLHCSDIVSGYEKGTKKALEILDSLAVKTVDAATDVDAVSEVLRSAMASKMYGYEEFLSELVADACIATVAGERSFDVDNVRVLKIMGGGVLDSSVIRGMVLQRPCETSVHHLENAKIAVFNCPVDPQQSDTKGTVLLSNAEELMTYTRSEEEIAQKVV